MKTISRLWNLLIFRQPDKETADLIRENRELRKLVAEMYDWTHHKNTRWARRAAKLLGLD